MMAGGNFGDRRAVREREASVYSGIPIASLQKFRCLGGGPRYIKVGARVLYLLSDLDAWLEAHRADDGKEQRLG